MNYTELKTEVADYLHRTDLVAKIPTFIALAEASMFRELDVSALESSAAGVTIGEYAALPADFGSMSKITVLENGREVTLDYKAGTLDEVVVTPTGYTIELNQIRLWGAGTGQAFTIYYKATLLPLSATVDTNWLLANAFDLYLYASALEGAKYVKDQGEIAVLGQMVSGLMASLKSKEARRSFPTSGSLRITPRR
jgi:hypothetical protein